MNIYILLSVHTECSWMAGSSGGVQGDRGVATVADGASVWKFYQVLGEIMGA
jgi:hypothetical protein